MALEVGARARRVRVASRAERCDVDVRNEEDIGERVAARRERVARGIALHRPLQLADLAAAEERPDEMELERIRVDDDESIARLPREDLLPSRDVPLDPESRGGLRLSGNDGVVRQRFEKGVRTRVLSAPGRLTRAARTLDDDDHVGSNVISGRSRKLSASGSAVAVPTTPATRNGPIQPAPRSSVAPATTGPSEPIPNPATA